MTKSSSSNRFWESLTKPYQWFFRTPDRALEQAYDAALMIQSIEDEHFNGETIAATHAKLSDSELAYFKAELGKYLNIARIRMTEFKASRSIINLSQWQIDPEVTSPMGMADFSERERSLMMLEKLKFIDQVLNRYQPKSIYPTVSTPNASISTTNQSVALVPNANGRTAIATSAATTGIQDQFLGMDKTEDSISRMEALSDKTGVLPRSILGTLDRLRRDLDPNAEQEVVKTFRVSKAKTVLSLRFILILLLVPLLTQQISKNFVIGPLVDRVRAANEDNIFLNFELEEEGLSELQRFEESLRFKAIVGAIPRLSTEEMEEKVKEKATEIAEDYRKQSADAVKNVIADFLSLIAFAIIIVYSRREIEILKTFLDELVYGLSDSAKAFIIILFTDIFVGFHSPHGWEVLLEGFARHLGLPANRDFIFIFIATFPVILDTVFKYWIFRYLNRVSPSAVATYRNMNE